MTSGLRSSFIRAPRELELRSTNVPIRTLIAAGLCLMLTGFAPRLAMAQEDNSQKVIPSLDLQQADVREAIRALFKNISVSYSIAPEVQGTVTVSLKNVSFETALQNILRQVDATYRVEGGVYEVVRRTETVAPVSGNLETPSHIRTTILRRIKIRSADPQFIAAMLGAKAGNQSYSIAPEMSTIAKMPSGGGNGGSGSNGGLGSGRSGSGSSGGFGSGSSGGLGGSGGLGSSGGLGGSNLGGFGG